MLYKNRLYKTSFTIQLGLWGWYNLKNKHLLWEYTSYHMNYSFLSHWEYPHLWEPKWTLINLQGLPGLQGSQSEQMDWLVHFKILTFFILFFLKQHTPYLVNKPPSTENKQTKNIFNGPLFCFIIYTPYMYFPSWVILFDDYISKEHCCDHVMCYGTIDNQSK